MKSGALNIVPTDDGNIFGNAAAGFAQRFNRAHGGDVVESEERRELRIALEQLARDAMAYFGGRRITVQLSGEFFFNDDSEFACNRENRLPTRFCIGTKILALDQRDSPVPEAVQVFESKVRTEIVIENDIRHSLDLAMTGDGDGGNVAIAAIDRIHGDDSLCGALPEKMRIFIDEILAVAMADDEIKIAFLKKVVFDAGKDHR